MLFTVLLLTLPALTSEAAAERRRVASAGPELELAEADRIEARVAGAACPAWEETLREPSWSSPALAATRAAFDGDREVDAVVDLAVRIHEARTGLGAMPTGPAVNIWQEQWTALDAVAVGLGERADDIAGTKAAVRELIELMTRTRAPLAAPIDAPWPPPRSSPALAGSRAPSPRWWTSLTLETTHVTVR